MSLPSRRTSLTLHRALALALAAATLLGAAPPPAELQAAGIGDRLFPTLGNPGYDVLSYDVDLDYSGHNDRPLNAVTEISARSTAALAHVNLDFARGTVHSVEVDGR